MKYLRLFEDFEKYLKPLGKLERTGDSSYDPYELMMIPPGKKSEMIIEQIEKGDKANLNLVSDLIALGANVDWQNEDSETMLHKCAYEDQSRIARMLLDAGVDLNVKDGYGFTALHVCAYINNSDIAKMLIDAGADVNIQTNGGETALHYCAIRNRPEIARMLVDAGADKTIPDDDGELPYEFADTQEFKELLQP